MEGVFFVGKSKEGGGDIERGVKELWRVFKDVTQLYCYEDANSWRAQCYTFRKPGVIRVTM